MPEMIEHWPGQGKKNDSPDASAELSGKEVEI